MTTNKIIAIIVAILCLITTNLYAATVFGTNSYDILFANLSRTNYSYSDLEDLLDVQSIVEYDSYLIKKNFSNFNHWTFSQNRPFFINYPRKMKNEFIKLYDFNFRQKLIPTKKGVSKLHRYYEDIYFIKRDFAINFARRCSFSERDIFIVMPFYLGNGLIFLGVGNFTLFPSRTISFWTYSTTKCPIASVFPCIASPSAPTVRSSSPHPSPHHTS